MYQQFITKKRLILGLIVILFAWVLIYISTHSILTVQGVGGEEKTIFIQRGKDDVKTEIFGLTDGSKTFILPKGFYTIGVEAPDKFSAYDVDLGGFSKRDVAVELKPQYSLKTLGESSFDCTLSPDSGNTTIFYPCSDYQGTFELKRGANSEPEVFIDPAIEKVFGHEHGPANTDNESIAPGFAALPYLSGVLSVVSDEGFLQSEYFGVKDGSVRLLGSAEMGEYSGEVSVDHFATVDGTKSERFTVLDRQEKNLLIFDNAGDNNPDSIDLSKELEDDHDDQAVRIATSDDLVFVIVSHKTDRLEFDEDHHFEPADDAHTEEHEVNQRVYLVDSNEKRVVKNYQVPDDVITFLEVAASPGGSLLMLPRSTKDRPGVHLVTTDSYRAMNMPQRGVSGFCWKSSDEFYYSVTSGSQIYERSLPKQASFLAYSNALSPIRNINCSGGVLTIALDSEKDDSEDFIHYALSDKVLSGARIENLVPFYIDVGRDTIKVTRVGLKLKIEKIFDGDNNQSTPSRQQSKESVLERLRDEGADVTGISFVFD